MSTGSHALVAFAVYAVSVMLSAAALAWPTHAVVATVLSDPPALHEWTADLLKIIALVGLWPLLRARELGAREGLGLHCPRGAWRASLVGIGSGVLTMGLVAVVLLATDVRVVRAGLDANLITQAAAKAAVTGIAVATIEELWFRGALQRVLRPCGTRHALVIVALVYAAVHFIRADQPVLAPYQWNDGFFALAGMFGRFSDSQYLDSALALVVAGLVLGVLRERTGCIAAGWGWHAGWVFVIQLTRRLTASGPGDAAWLVGTYDGIIGVAFVAVAVGGLAVIGLSPRIHPPRGGSN